MAQHGKKMLEARKKFDQSTRYELHEALQTGEGTGLCQI